MSQAVMREVVGDRTVNEVLTVGRTKVAQRVKDKLQKLCEEYSIGVRIAQVIPQDITPPDKVQPSFNEVNAAQQEKETLVNQAKAQKNKELPKARGEADRKIQQAEGYAVQRINRAEGKVKRFNEVYKEYRKAPEVTKRRIFIETLSEVLPKVDRKIVVDEDATDVVPLMPSKAMQQLTGGN
jgi:membrane protease subunit HflK